MRSSHIHHFITELSIGGAQMALYRLLSQLKPRGYQLSVSCLYNGDGVVAAKIRGLGIDVFDWGMGQQKWRLDAFGRFYTYLRKTNPDLLHTWMFHANIPGRVLGHWAGVQKIISAERTMGQESSKRNWLNRQTARYTDAITCVSDQVAAGARTQIGLPADKLVVIPNGIDLEEYAALPTQHPSTGSGQAAARTSYNLPQNCPLVAAIGRPRPVKGLNFLVDGWPQVIKKYPSSKLVIVGDGPSKSELEAQVRQNGSAESVIFMGDQHNIPQLLPAFDMLVLPSLHEGMPNVALEAMAAGLPVVATNVGGTPEVVVANETGLLVPPKNPTALADAIQQLLADPQQAQAFGRAGKTRITNHFSLENTIQQTEALYKKLL